MRDVQIAPTFESWQAAARALLREGVPPGEVAWLVGMAARARRRALRAEEEEAFRLEEEGGGAAPYVPAGARLDELRAAAARCTGCDLYRHATQAVFGHGPADARAMLLGEQPGDQEDPRGAPFVRPAGEVLDRALAESAASAGSTRRRGWPRSPPAARGSRPRSA